MFLIRFEYNGKGTVTEYMYSATLADAFQGKTTLHSLLGIGPKRGFLPSEDAIIFLMNHDNQRKENDPLEIYKERCQYEMALAFMYAHPYGIINLFSSYEFDDILQGNFIFYVFTLKKYS